MIIHLYSYCDTGMMDRVFWTPCILYNVLLISNLVCTNAVPSSNCTTLFVLMCVKTQYRNWNEIIIDKKILCSLNNLFLLPSSISAQWHQNVRVSLICGVRSIILMSIYKINHSIYTSYIKSFLLKKRSMCICYRENPIHP